MSQMLTTLALTVCCISLLSQKGTLFCYKQAQYFLIFTKLQFPLQISLACLGILTIFGKTKLFLNGKKWLENCL